MASRGKVARLPFFRKRSGPWQLFSRDDLVTSTFFFEKKTGLKDHQTTWNRKWGPLVVIAKKHCFEGVDLQKIGHGFRLKEVEERTWFQWIFPMKLKPRNLGMSFLPISILQICSPIHFSETFAATDGTWI